MMFVQGLLDGYFMYLFYDVFIKDYIDTRWK